MCEVLVKALSVEKSKFCASEQMQKLIEICKYVGNIAMDNT